MVVEAGPRSGTQITANYAGDYGRDIMAASGPITSQYHEGVKKLLNNGAVLVGSGQEVIANLSAQNWQELKDEVGFGRLLKGSGGVDQCGRENKSFGEEICCSSCGESKNNSNLLRLASTSEQKAVLSALQSLPASLEDISNNLQLPMTKVGTTLTELELKGLVQSEANLWSLVGSGY